MTMQIILPQLVDQLLDLGGGDRIERRARLVHQDDVGIDRHGAGDDEALLLTAGKAGAGLVQPVLHFVPQAGAPERRFSTISSMSALVFAMPWMRGP